ncbi:MAG: hypothetical protein ACKO41_02350 [Sphingomonadales bacterium]
MKLIAHLTIAVKDNLRYFQNVTATFCSQAITALSVLFLTPYLLRSLGEENFNQYWVILNLIVVAAASDLGLSVGLSHRLIIRKRNYSLFITTVLGAQLLIFFLALPLLYLVFYVDLLQVSGNAMLLGMLVSVIMLQNMVALLFDGVLQSFNKIYVSKWVRVAKTLAETIVIFFLIQDQRSFISLLVATAAINLLYVGLLVYFSRKTCRFQLSARYFSIRVLRQHLRYSMPYLLTIVAGLIAFNVQILLLKSLLLPFYMALFLLLFRFFEIIRTALTNFTLVLFPSISGLQASGKWVQIEQLFFVVLKRVSLLALVVLLFLMVAGKQLFSWWSGYSLIQEAPLFYLFCFYTVLIVVDHVSVVFQYSLNIQQTPALVSIVQSIVSLLLTIYLVGQMGVAGALWASLISAAGISFIFNPIYLLRAIRKNKALTVAA